MAGPWKHFTRIVYVFLCLISGLAVGHWQDMKNRTNGVVDVLEDSEEGFFGRGSVSGPFEDPSRSSRVWTGYINENRAVVKDGIDDIGKSLLKGAEEVELLTGDKKDKTGGGRGGSGWYAQKNWKQNMEMMRNWSGYLEGKRSKWDKPAPFQATEFESGVGENGNHAKINGFLKRLRTGPMKAKAAPGNCDQTETDKEIIRQMKKSLAETFMYRNVTLSDISRMMKVVDFVDRYRGRIRGFGGGGGAGAKRDNTGFLPGGPAAGSVIAPPV